MSYQVLARKWRPKNFQELIGQEHVVNVLANALSQQRLHHAYLFTGTRGVGKTTIARIFAKSLNCEIGITAKPCGECDACIDIDQGRFVDLLEIDAASKTKVDDTREILDNVQYAPSRGRFKVYLIDEVHMLSRHSFNALLKTLEEPPEHVKFILATTDPQKLPVTVLSRCLQFHLKALTVKQIEEKLAEILSKEQVTYEQGCLTLLAKAARGSMRDSLSLTDQAIAQGQGNISLANIQQMLGGIDQNWVYQLVVALLKQDSQALMALSQEIASYAPSYSRLFAELIQLFHQIALLQIVDQHFDLPADLLTLLKKFSQAMSAEDVQLYYQISLNGRKDLPYAFDEQAAFDMTLLRLIAFKPMQKPPLSSEAIVATNVYANEASPNEVNFNDVALAKTAQIPPSTAALDQKPVVATTTETAVVDTQSEPMVNPEVIEPFITQDNIQQNELNEQMLAIEQQADDFSNSDRAMSHQAAGMPSEAVGIPEQAAGMPSEAVGIPDQAAGMPSEAVGIPEQAASIPSEAAVIPDEIAAIAEPTTSIVKSNEQQKPTPLVNQQDGQLSIDSPVASVLATRNMLRSRKKELEKHAKKPSDAALRQSSNLDSSKGSAIAAPVESQVAATASAVIVPEPEAPFHQDNINPATITKANQVDKWAHMIDSMQLTARIRQLAIHATISEDSTDDNLILLLNQATRHLKTDVAQQQLQSYICQFLSRQVTVTLNIVEETVADPYQIQVQINDKRLDYVKALLKEDAVVIALQDTFQASLNEESIAPR
ncbi:DNA polymerase III subunit gamma/tau [Colwellia sp. MT41]|uniref:DNA polymerase III subunit gamma/tau n=1 Tax=Colwellia sp. MT41 TaxID=58049 RepID=UPI0007175D58|nr:DNA polymerase III subunit gamma/tau [Colwellia sp. MT41]ALO35517.1 DNA polymerase III subunit gamma/tau [Colwellia sp. MT41]